MFRGSAYSIKTDQDIINKSQLIEEQVRVALIGIREVGKSSMLACIQNEKFRQEIASTKGIQLRFKKLRMNNYAINFYVWDGPGDKMLEFVDQGQFSSMDGFLEVFDLTDKQSFHQLEQLHYQIKKNFQKIGKSYISVLSGNKSDLAYHESNFIKQNKQIDCLAQKFAKRQQLLYIKTSAKGNSSVKDSFIQLIKKILVARCRGKSSRIFHEQEQISGNSKGQSVNCCSCCKSLGSCNLCRIF